MALGLFGKPIIDLDSYELLEELPSDDLPCPWCRSATSEDDDRCPGCSRRFG